MEFGAVEEVEGDGRESNMTDHLCVGREEEIRQLYTLFESSLRGDKQLCFITGEAGLGKTTLVN